jgi:hypothetical protein
MGTDYPCVASADASLRPGRTGPIRRAGGGCVCRWVVARARAHRVERAEALVLDDAAGDREGAAGGAELEADLRGEGGRRPRVPKAVRGKMRRAGVGWSAVGGSAGRRSPARGERGGVWRRRFGRGANARGEPPRGSRGTEAASPTEATNAPRPNRRGQTPRRDRARAHLDDVQGLDDAGGAHAGDAAVEERLDRVPGGVISERHRGSRGVGRMRRARRSVGARGDRRPGLVGPPIGAEAQLVHSSRCTRSGHAVLKVCK